MSDKGCKIRCFLVFLYPEEQDTPFLSRRSRSENKRAREEWFGCLVLGVQDAKMEILEIDQTFSLRIETRAEQTTVPA